MDKVNYEAMLIAITYLETFINEDVEQRRLLIDSVDSETLTIGLTAFSRVLIGVSAKALKVESNPQHILSVARKIALDKTVEF